MDNLLASELGSATTSEPAAIISTLVAPQFETPFEKTERAPFSSIEPTDKILSKSYPAGTTKPGTTIL